MADKNFNDYVISLIQDCLKNCMSKDEAAKHIWKIYMISPERTIQVWENLERQHQEYFTSYYAWLRHRKTATPPVDLRRRRRLIFNTSGREQEQQQRLPTRRSLMATSQDFHRDAVASSSLQVPREAPNANANANTNDADFRQQLMVMLAKIERNTDQMVKLMTDGCGPHRSAAGSLTRQRVEQTKESGDNEESEILQEKERGDNEETEKQREESLKRQRIELTKESGDNEEAEKLQEKERSDNEEAEKLQEKDRGDNEAAEKQSSCKEGPLMRQRVEQTKESGDNKKTENLQEKERGDNEEAEKL